MVMWRGLSRLTDIALGALVGAENVGIESFTGRLPHNTAPMVRSGR